MSTPYCLFIAGSRQATPAMLQTAYRAVERAKEHGWTVLVGDNPQGVDVAVVRACDRLGIDVTVIGIARQPRNGGSRRRSSHYIWYQTGSYTQRDRYLASMADRGLFIWNGASRGTKAVHDYMATLDKPVHLMTFG